MSMETGLAGKEIVGEVSASSAAIMIYTTEAAYARIRYGYTAGDLSAVTETKGPKIGSIKVPITGLRADNRYFYRLEYRPLEEEWETGEVRTFRTQRATGQSFNFSIMADSHIYTAYNGDPENPTQDQLERRALYDIALYNISQSNPDFLISLGDFALMTDDGGVQTIEEAVGRYLQQRKHIDQLCHSVPFHLCIGNHEGENGWLESAFRNRCMFARLETTPGCGARYYSWTWGDAQFIILSPYTFTTENPKTTQDGWTWTIGKTQYDWLHDQLAASSSTWKFVFIHHLTSTFLGFFKNPYYGRGGIEAAKYAIAHNPSYEWGGENPSGGYGFDSKRPGWEHGPIHDMLVNYGVTAVFHGHDHCYARQPLDDIAYIEVPTPSNNHYNRGFMDGGGYTHGVLRNNSGHVTVGISPDSVNIKYIRAYIPGHGDNGEVSDDYTINR